MSTNVAVMPVEAVLSRAELKPSRTHAFLLGLVAFVLAAQLSLVRPTTDAME